MDTSSSPSTKKAQLRFQWTKAGIKGRIPPLNDVAWLAFGDILTVLHSLDSSEWQLCMRSEFRRRSRFEEQLRVVKAFRDYHWAHPKPHNPTKREIRRLCFCVRQMPITICPSQWNAARAAIEVIRRRSEDERKDIIWEGMGLTHRSDALDKFVAAFVAENSIQLSFVGAHKQRDMLRWVRELVSYLSELDPGGDNWFGIST